MPSVSLTKSEHNNRLPVRWLTLYSPASSIAALAAKVMAASAVELFHDRLTSAGPLMDG